MVTVMILKLIFKLTEPTQSNMLFIWIDPIELNLPWAKYYWNN